MKCKFYILSVISSFIVVTQSGCILVGLAAGAGYMAYDKGDLEVTEPIAYNDAFDAVDVTVKDMDMALVKREKKALGGFIHAKSHYGKVTYNLENKGEKLTAISIRVGSFGDQAAQRHIYAKLKGNYGSGPQVDPNTGLPQ